MIDDDDDDDHVTAIITLTSHDIQADISGYRNGLIIVYSKIPLKDQLSINFMIQPRFYVKPQRTLCQRPVETLCTPHRSADNI